jgi:hypothetical protein
MKSSGLTSKPVRLYPFDEIIRTNKQTSQIVPLRNIVCGPIEPTVPQLESWAVSDNGASEAFNMYEANDIWMQHGSDPQVNACRRMIWLRRVGMFLDYKIAYSKDSECTEWLDVFSPADALHVKYPLSPITIYATKQGVDQYKDRLDFINITEIGEAQAMMAMVRHEFIGNLQNVSTDIMRMHMDPEFWYKQHNFDSDAHHLSNNMIDMVPKYMKGDATRMETYIDLGAVVYEFKHCKGIFARSKLTMAMHADFYNLPYDTRYNAPANSSNKIKYWKERSLSMIVSNYCRPRRHHGTSLTKKGRQSASGEGRKPKRQAICVGGR